MRLLKIGLITGFGLGYIPIAPATFGCLISVVVWYFFVGVPFIYFAIFLNLFLWGLIISDEFVKEWGNDPGKIVIDEYSTFLLPLYFVPRRVLPVVIAFVLFRFFDILKPPPLRQLEKIGGAWGIMLDDLGAAVYTTIIMIALLFFHI
jgi:phosphatidylglycerophosphatase A